MGIKQATSNGLKWSEVQVHLEIGPRLGEMGEIIKQRVHPLGGYFYSKKFNHLLSASFFSTFLS